jgi:long-chain acyl-CoA synthetase
MLYDRWCQIVNASPDRLALCEPPSGRVWTFRELAMAAESEPGGPLPVAFPTGAAAEFVLAVLRAWQAGQVVCPLEPGQPPPRISTGLPAGIAHLKTTSASTGTPRLVAFTPAQLAADAENIMLTMGLRAEWPNLGVISLAHSYGFSNLVLPLLLHGIPLILVGAALPEAVRRAAALADAVTLPAVPALWQSWHEAGAIPPVVRLAISAGAPLPLGLEQAVFACSGVKIHNFYGSTECGGIAFDATPLPRADGACAGAPLRNVHVEVVEDGCIVVRSPAVGLAYWPEADVNLRDGLFHTSDLGEIAEGLVFLRGRASDQINVAGRKVLPETIERVLAAHPDVRACVAFGVPSPDSQRVETIVACVAGKAGTTGESLKQFAMTKLAPWQVPREWWFVDALEANNRGKFSRALWRQRYLDRAAGRG